MNDRSNATESKPEMEYHGPQILMVDDEIQILNILNKVLGRRYRVRASESPREALAMLQDSPADIIISDEKMPGMSGIEFLKEAGRLVPGAKKILLTGAFDIDSVIASINEAEIDFFLSKPLRLEEITQAIEKLWNNRLLEKERDALYTQNEEIVHELSRLNRELEGKVKLRTDELTGTNHNLIKALEEIEEKNRELTNLNESLNIQASVDSLTGLYNRREFDNRLRNEWARFQRHHRHLSLIMLDIDHFKKVNDRYGHDCGDAVLQSLGRIMLSQRRRQDILCRYGGEEFVILLPDTSLEAAFNVAETLRSRVGEFPFRCGKIKLTVLVSLGVAGALEQMPKDDNAFLKIADTGLYRAKNEGRNRTVILDGKDLKTIQKMSET